MDPEILISFIVPVYNVEKTLSRCLDSILIQSNKSFEIIIVNDGSKDSSQDIIDKYVLANPGTIKSFIKENGGPGDSRNYGIKKAIGRYITFVDSDDHIEPNYSEVVMKLINNYNPDMVVISYNRIYNKKQNIFERFHKFDKWEVYNKPIAIAAKPELICNIEAASWLKIVRRELFSKNEFLFFTDSSIAEDLEASLKWYLNVNTIIVSNDKLYNYVISSNTLNFSDKNIEQFIEIIDSVCTYYKDHGKFKECYSELEYLFAKHMLISNILRLKASKRKNKYQIFLFLRSSMVRNFPRYTKNIYFKSDPYYLRIAIIISFYFPKFFYFILSNRIRF